MDYLLLALGLIILIKGVQVFVDAASSTARILGIPSFLIGMSIVAFGTSAPEAAIGIVSGIQKTNLLTLGDVIGSTIVNIALVLGLTAMIHPLKITPLIATREIPLSLLVKVILIGMLWTGWMLSRLEAGLLLLGFVFFIVFLARKSREILQHQRPESEADREIQETLKSEELFEKGLYDAPVETDGTAIARPLARGPVRDRKSLFKLGVKLIIGLGALLAGSEMTVLSSEHIAKSLGISDEFIGLTIVAIGTSLPELATCIVAALRREEDIAVGNIVGSNVFDVLFVLGISGLIHPIAITSEIYLELGFMFLVSLILLVTTLIKPVLTRRTGSAFVASYLLFIALKIYLLTQAN